MRKFVHESLLNKWFYFSNTYWNPSNIRNGNISSTCSNGTNNPALVFGEGINNFPYEDFITSHSAVTNFINISDYTHSIHGTLQSTQFNSFQICYTTSPVIEPTIITSTNNSDTTATLYTPITTNSIDTTATLYTPITTNSIKEEINPSKIQVIVNCKTNLLHNVWLVSSEIPHICQIKI